MIFRANAKFFGHTPAAKNEKESIFIKRKKRNSFRPAISSEKKILFREHSIFSRDTGFGYIIFFSFMCHKYTKRLKKQENLQYFQIV